MYKVGQRSFRRAITPVRVRWGAFAVGAIAVGFLLAGIGPGFQLAGVIVVVLGAAGLSASVVFPMIREIGLGFPVGVGLRAALRTRERDMLAAFTAQEDEFTLYAHLLCSDPGVATALLEAAWERTAAQWRGPVTPEIRVGVLRAFIDILEAHEPSTGPRMPGPAPLARDGRSLAGLPSAQRIVVVLHEWAGLSLTRIAGMTRRPLPDVADDLRVAWFVVGVRGEDQP